MSEKQKIKKITFNYTEEEHTTLKMMAVVSKRTITDIIKEALAEYLNNYKVQNDERNHR